MQKCQSQYFGFLDMGQRINFKTVHKDHKGEIFVCMD